MNGLDYSEISVPIGASLILIGISLWASNYLFEVFHAWSWAILTGLTFVSIGYLFLYSDFRVYVGDKTVTEEFISGGD